MSETTREATRVVVSYDESTIDEELRYWVDDELRSDTFRASLRRRHDRAAPGDEWEEFVSRGCGLPVDVTLRVEGVEGGPRLGDETSVEIVVRE